MAGGGGALPLRPPHPLLAALQSAVSVAQLLMVTQLGDRHQLPVTIRHLLQVARMKHVVIMVF
jgi:hypothetical protein